MAAFFKIKGAGEVIAVAKIKFHQTQESSSKSYFIFIRSIVIKTLIRYINEDISGIILITSL